MPSTDFSALMLNPIYATLGTDAVLVPENGPSLALTVIDKTSGADLSILGPMEFQALVPAVTLRAADLTDAGLVKDDLPGMGIEVNGTLWRIDSHRQRPVPSGAGEVWLILSEPDQ